MLRAGDGKVDEAWEDLLACHRLARLVGQGPFFIDAIVAIAVDGIACAGDQAVLLHAPLAPPQLAKMRADLDKLPSVCRLADKSNIGERFFFLDLRKKVARQGAGAVGELYSFYDEEPEHVVKSMIDSAAGRPVDWDQSLRIGNFWYDRLADAYDKPVKAERRAALRKIADELGKLAMAAKHPESSGLSTSRGSQRDVSRRIGEFLVGSLAPTISWAARAEDRGAMQFAATRLAFALAAYRADRGGYPAKLADLAPKYIAEIPKDIFNDADLHYRQENGGYLLYSVGPNGKDDGGKGRDECKNGEGWDDIAVHMPAAASPKP